MASGNSVIAYLKNADKFLEMASAEVHRPSEDAVGLCTCQCTRKSVMELFRSFLAERNSAALNGNSLEGLFWECRRVDPAFDSLDISCFSCRSLDNNCTGGYCLEIERVNACFDQALMVRKFVLSKLNNEGKEMQEL